MNLSCSLCGRRVLSACLLVLLIVLLGKASFAQKVADSPYNNFSMGVNLGGAASQVDGDGCGGYRRFSPTGGIWVRLQLPKDWSASLQFRYMWKGSYATTGKGENQHLQYSLSLHYLELPLLAEYSFLRHWRVGLGLSAAYLMASQEKNAYGEIPLEGVRKPSPFELAAHATGAYVFNARWAVQAGFSYSALPFRGKMNDVTSPVRSGQYNRAITLMVSYSL